MSTIYFERITGDYSRFGDIKRIYEEAFPENERFLSIEGLVSESDKSDSLRLSAAIEDDKVIGFIVYYEREKYMYGLFFAIDNSLRGQGYGSKLFKNFVDKHADKPMIFDIETPGPNTPNNEQRIKREKFYLRLGLIKTEYNISYGGDNYTFFTTREDSNLKEYIDDWIAFGESVKDEFKN